MTLSAPGAIAAIQALEAVLRQDRGRLLAALIARLRDFQLAEDALQDAAISALGHWGRAGLPQSPQGWLLKVAFRKALDRIKSRDSETRRRQGQMILAAEEGAEPADVADIPDDRLRLIFTCCHPALEPKSQVALTLRTVCGLTTADIARAFLDTEPTMGQRLSRAKAKISKAGIPFAVPGPELWADRLDAVLTTAYLIFTTGYSAGPQEPRDLCTEAIFLIRLIDHLRPNEAEVEGALALMLLTNARRAARVREGATVPPSQQDRALWDAAQIAEGRAVLACAFARRRPGPFQIKAAIADCHMADPVPDWPQIAALYDVLARMEPTPVVTLNRAVALAETGEVLAALALIDSLVGILADYQPFHAARAAVLARVGNWAEADMAYERAIRLAGNAQDAAFLISARLKLPLIGQS
jgi:RNA polymerase sigma factor (sigma-70 family)